MSLKPGSLGFVKFEVNDSFYLTSIKSKQSDNCLKFMLVNFKPGSICKILEIVKIKKKDIASYFKK